MFCPGVEVGVEEPVTEDGLFMETVAVFARPASTEVIVLLPTVRPLAIVVTIPDVYAVDMREVLIPLGG